MTESELRPCRVCGRDCIIQHFPNANAMLWMCSSALDKSAECGADCYLSANAWNDYRPRTHPPEYARRIEAAKTARADIRNACDWVAQPYREAMKRALDGIDAALAAITGTDNAQG